MNVINGNAIRGEVQMEDDSITDTTQSGSGEDIVHVFHLEHVNGGNSASQACDVVEDGMRCESKRLYEDISEYGETSWVTEIPAKIKARQATDTTIPEFALLLRTRFIDDRGELHSIVVQSPLLQAALKEIVQNYPGVFAGKNPLIFESPFRPIVHRWAELENACKQYRGTPTGQHLELFQKTMEIELKAAFTAIKDFNTYGAIEFEQLWIIFPPDSIAVSVKDKTEFAYRVTKTEIYHSRQEGRAYFIIQCYYIDWDGNRFGRAPEYLIIPEFEGSAAPSDLSAYPLDCHPQKDRIIKTLTENGKKFEALAGTFYRAYSGIAIDYGAQTPTPYHVNGRIVIDTATYMRFNPHMQSNLAPLEAVKKTSTGKEEDEGKPEMEVISGYSRPFFNIEPRTMAEGMHEATLSGLRRTKQLQKTQAQLLPDQLLICRNLVRGYSLSLKKWLDFHVDSITEIKWNATAFDSLALPGNYKHLLLAFAKSQSTSAANFDDVIKGKGKGMVVLLEGPPGVGKTLTVESVAEEMRVPLFSITTGDLGSDAISVQRKLTEAFDIAKSWKAVVLLDEADIFLEKRTINDLVRNQLVSIFLQNLEYYEGTIFLTTNRVECIDRAFESRIHITFQYPELETDSRHKVWKTFLSTLQMDTSSITEAHLDRFASIELNGRQIKNAVKMAGLLASAEGAFKPGHVEEVLKIMKKGV